MLRRLTVLMLAGLAAVAVGVGCGGSDDSSTTTGEVSKAQFAAKATKLCDEARQDYLSEAPEAFQKEMKASNGSEPPQKVEARVIQTVLADSLDAKATKVRQLEVPPGDEKQVEAILAAIEDVADKARAEPEKFLFQQANFKHPFYRARQLADAYDIGHCARA